MRLLLPALGLATLAAACIENEETITVGPDGSVTVEVKAKGDLRDLADGYAVPLGPGWELEGADTRRWLEQLGDDTGSAAVRARMAGLRIVDPDGGPAGGAGAWWPGRAGKHEPEATLVARRTFTSAEALPSTYAVQGDPYASAYLAREAKLEIRRHGARTIYVFERVMRGPRESASALTLAGELLPADLKERLEAEEVLSELDLRRATKVIARAFGEQARQAVRYAVLRLYEHGAVSPPAEVLEQLVERTGRAVADVLTPQEFGAIYHGMLGDERPAAEERLRELEAHAREVLREAFLSGLVEAGVPDDVRHAAAFSLEWGFTAYDHALDLQDESFEVRVAMPGTVVGGSFDRLEDGLAVWELEAQEVVGREVHMRVVSVLE